MWRLRSTGYVYGMDRAGGDRFSAAVSTQGVSRVEDGVPATRRADLQSRGHRVVRGERAAWAAVRSIEIDREQGTLIGGSDPRKDGLALGC